MSQALFYVLAEVKVSVNNSGTHPFDYRLESQCGPDLEVGSVVSSSRRSHFSQSSVISEQVVKSRIVKGEIDFDDDVWDSMPDGAWLDLVL